MYEKRAVMRKIKRNLAVVLFFALIAESLNASALSGYFNSLSNSNYNLMIAPVFITNKRAKQSRIAIKRGYSDQIRKLTRVIASKKLKANIINPRKFLRKSKHEQLVTMELEKLNQSLLTTYNAMNKKTATTTDAFDDFSESDFEDVNTDKGQKNELELIAENTLFKVSKIYLNREVYTVNKIEVTLRDSSGKIIKMVKPDSLFLESFKPYDKKREYYIDVRIFLVILNSTTNNITVMTKEIVNAKFNNNSALITGKTGQVLRELLSEALNVPI